MLQATSRGKGREVANNKYKVLVRLHRNQRSRQTGKKGNREERKMMKRGRKKA